MAGRPSQRTPRRRTAILASIAEGATKEAAAAGAGMHRQRLYEWEKADRTFADEMTRAQDEAERRMVLHVIKASVEDWRAAAWWLSRRRHEHYGDRSKVEVAFDTDKAAEQVAAETGMSKEAVLAGVEAILRESD